MLLLEVHTPGVWLDMADREHAFRLKGLLDTLRGQFFDANVALVSFEESSAEVEQARRKPVPCDGAGIPISFWRKREIHKQLIIEGGVDEHLISFDGLLKIIEEVQRRYDREQQGNGLPLVLLGRRPLMFARAFVYALDSFSKCLRVLSKDAGAPGNLSALYDKLMIAFPDLLGVRNTSHHIEDRVRGLNKKLQPLAVQPVVTPEVISGGGIFLNNLFGTRYSCTMDDGHLGAVDVSENSLRALHEVLEEVLRSFAWRGPANTGYAS